MLGELVEVGTKLSEVSDRLQQAGNAKRQRIADYFLSIEKCLQDSAEQLKKGVAPNNKWGELDTYGWELPEHYREIFKVACFETHMEMLNEYNQKNIIALKKMPKNIELMEFSNDIQKKAKEATSQELKSLAQDSIFKEVYEEWEIFREQIAWIDNIDSIRAKRP